MLYPLMSRALTDSIKSNLRSISATAHCSEPAAFFRIGYDRHQQMWQAVIYVQLDFLGVD